MCRREKMHGSFSSSRRPRRSRTRLAPPVVASSASSGRPTPARRATDAYRDALANSVPGRRALLGGLSEIRSFLGPSPANDPVQQIRRILRRLPTFTVPSGMSGETVCQICLETLEAGEEARTLPCFHIFHRACIDEWLATRQTCPLCLAGVYVE